MHSLDIYTHFIHVLPACSSTPKTSKTLEVIAIHMNPSLLLLYMCCTDLIFQNYFREPHTCDTHMQPLVECILENDYLLCFVGYRFLGNYNILIGRKKLASLWYKKYSQINRNYIFFGLVYLWILRRLWTRDLRSRLSFMHSHYYYFSQALEIFSDVIRRRHQNGLKIGAVSGGGASRSVRRYR